MLLKNSFFFVLFLFFPLFLLKGIASEIKETIEIEEDPGKHLYPCIQKITNDFYTARIPDKRLSLVMERVDSSTYTLWKNYIDVQSNPRTVMLASKDSKGTTGDGSMHFKAVLEEISNKDNEIWVAYITKADIPERIPNHMILYNAGDIMPSHLNSFARDIEMFVTVTSTPKALITSHMGIASTAESVLVGRTRGTSIDLHSFAAKVMLMRNPNRRYMVNAPVFAMEKIMVDALPNSVYVGTREMQQIMKERQDITFEEFKAENEAKIYEKLKTEAEKDRKSYNSRLKRSLRLIKEGKIEGETEESLRLEEAQKKIPGYRRIEMGSEGKYIVSEKKITAALPDEIIEEFEDFKNPYYFGKNKNSNTKDFLKFMEKNPPIFSVDRKNRIDEKFALFDPKDSSKPWLSVDKANKDYQWMFTDPFSPAGITHYCVVDLVALANSKPVASPLTLEQAKENLMEKVWNEIKKGSGAPSAEADLLIDQALKMKNHLALEEVMQVLALKPNKPCLVEELLKGVRSKEVKLEDLRTVGYWLSTLIRMNLENKELASAQTILKILADDFNVLPSLQEIKEWNSVEMARFMYENFRDNEGYRDAFGTSKLQFLDRRIAYINKLRIEPLVKESSL